MRKLFRYGNGWQTLICFIVGLVLVMIRQDYVWVLGLLDLVCFLLELRTLVKTSQRFRLIDDLIQHCDLRTVPKILDINTGCGYFMTQIAKAAGSIAFVDGIEDQRANRIRAARKNARHANVYNRVNVIHGDVCHLPFPDTYFNLVTLTVYNARLKSGVDVAKNVIAEALRVLKRNGRLLIVSDRKAVLPLRKTLASRNGVNFHSAAFNRRKAGWQALIAKKMI